MPARRPVAEVLERGRDDAPAAGPLARLADWWLERPRRPRRRRPTATGVALLLAGTLGADLLVLARHQPARPARPTVPPAVLAERRRVAGAVARFVQGQQCEGSDTVAYRVTDHDPDWSTVRYEVLVGAGTPIGALVLDIEPFDVGVRYRVVSATGTCRE